jgi:2-alkenal reductase
MLAFFLARLQESLNLFSYTRARDIYEKYLVLKENRMNSHPQSRIILIAAAISIITLACGTLSINLPKTVPAEIQPTVQPQISPSGLQPVIASAQPSLPKEPLITTNEEAILVDLYKRVNPSVVNIIIYSTSQSRLMTPASQGSGFLFDEQGDIVTNSHVVHGADEIDIIFSDGSTQTGKLLGEDLNSDLAVIKVDQVPPDAKPIPVGDMNQVAVGQTVVAIGNPFGLGGTLTRGIVSALGRTIPAMTSFYIPQAIQTDAPINPGNSGGPLLNLQGKLIGVNAQIETGGTSRSNSGIGFAIPVNIVARVVPVLIQNGTFQWGWLGVSGFSVTPAMISAMKLPVTQGAYVSQIVAGGPAEQAGLRGTTREVTQGNRQVEVGGDVITAINGVQVSSFDDILIYIALYTNPGQQVTLSIIRSGKTQDILLTLQPRPQENVDLQSP